MAHPKVVAASSCLLLLSVSTLVLLLLQSAVVEAYSNGAPVGESCRTLYPGHGVDKQYGRSSYRVSAMRRLNDSSIVVTIYSPTDTFLGFIMQARLYSDREMLVNGAFSTDQYSRALDCLGGYQVSRACFEHSVNNKQKLLTELTDAHRQLPQVQDWKCVDSAKELRQWHCLPSHSSAVKERLLDGHRLWADRGVLQWSPLLSVAERSTEHLQHSQSEPVLLSGVGELAAGAQRLCGEQGRRREWPLAVPRGTDDEPSSVALSQRAPAAPSSALPTVAWFACEQSRAPLLPRLQRLQPQAVLWPAQRLPSKANLHHAAHRILCTVHRRHSGVRNHRRPQVCLQQQTTSELRPVLLHHHHFGLLLNGIFAWQSYG